MRILALRLRQIGDVVFTTPAIRGLRERFPDAHLSYVVEPAAAPVVAANPHLNEVIVTAGRGGAAGMRDDLALVRRLRAHPYDMVIDFHGGPRSSLIAWLSGAPVRVGYAIRGRAWMYTLRVPRPRHIRPRHAVLNQWDLLAALGIAPPEPAAAAVEMPVDAAAGVRVAQRLAAAGVAPGDRVIVVHVSAGNPFRRWGLERFAELVSMLARVDASRRVVVTAGPSEHNAAATVIGAARSRLTGDAGRRVLECGEFSLAEFRALVDQAALYIGGDSGPLHVASTSHVPIVGLYGPTLPVRSAPWREPAWLSEAVEVGDLPCRPCNQRRCVPGDFRCLTSIAPERVVEIAERVLARQAFVARQAFGARQDSEASQASGADQTSGRT
jgi:lipopolysaccharide heptosyltransferase II